MISSMGDRSDEHEAAIAACDGLRGYFSTLLELLQDPRLGREVFLRFRDPIARAHRAVTDVGGTTEAARFRFFRIIEDAAHVQLGRVPESIQSSRVLALRRMSIQSDLFRLVRLQLAFDFPDIAGRLTDEMIADAVNACILARPGRPKKGEPAREDRFSALMRVWRKLSPEDSAGASTARTSMKKPRKGGQRKR